MFHVLDPAKLPCFFLHRPLLCHMHIVQMTKPRSRQQLKVQYGLPRHFVHPFMNWAFNFLGTSRNSLIRLASRSSTVSRLRFCEAFAAGCFTLAEGCFTLAAGRFKTSLAAGRFLAAFSQEDSFFAIPFLLLYCLCRSLLGHKIATFL